MKIGNLFDLFTDAKDLAEFFEGVTSREQLISRLELLKRQDTDDFLACIIALPVSIENLLNDVLEMSASVDESEELTEDDSDKELNSLVGELNEIQDSSPSENDNPVSESIAADPNTVVTPAE